MSARILVVDDIAANVRLLEAKLAAEYFEVVTASSGPEALEPAELPRPEAREGWTLVRVMAFGLNRSELFTRRGLSPTVGFPRVLGIECVGVGSHKYTADQLREAGADYAITSLEGGLPPLAESG